MATLRSRISYSFGIALLLFAACLIYFPHWKQYVTIGYQSERIPYLTPWTTAFITLLSLALALISAPVSRQHPGLAVIPKVICALVICTAVVFLLEYATGIRFPDLDAYFLPVSTGPRVTIYAARPSPYSAATSLFLSFALALYRFDSGWRKRFFQLLVASALLLPSISAVRYMGALLVSQHSISMFRAGLSLPAVILFFLLGSGMLGLTFRARARKVTETGFRSSPVRPI